VEKVITEVEDIEKTAYATDFDQSTDRASNDA